jgi:uncharacterized protein YbjT (DUF2867 family)
VTVLVTGGTGHLGRAIVALLRRDGHAVRVLARRPGDDRHLEWVRGDLATGHGVADAVSGVDTVIHAATNSPAAQRGGFRPIDFVHSPQDVDIAGTKRLLAAAEDFGHVSIVGLQHMARLNPYSRVKLAAEQTVRDSNVPWSIVRATGFYWLLDRMLTKMARRRTLWLPADVRMEAVDSDDFAAYAVACLTDGRRGEREDFAGPQTLTMRKLADEHLAARGLERRILNAPLPRRVTSALTGANTSPDARRGATTWAQWLQRSGTSRSASPCDAHDQSRADSPSTRHRRRPRSPRHTPPGATRRA